ncbi:MAG: hypothetical protein HKN98_16830 [Silicimonas sp.]|nr:hypothetical protein [Silicimonas sp.]NND20239.1 hypothetical protein [Silicimonas sp.]NND43664.1 hypothetical protein [Silicimonas sp.]NNF92667.1 hypothetical protein [Boseongicola sp.]
MRHSKLTPLAALALAALMPSAVLAEGNMMETGLVWTPPSGKSGDIANSHAALLTSEDGAAMRLKTSGFEPGHVITVWFVAVQRPENCLERPCPPTDAMGRSDEVNSVAALGGSAVANENGEISVAGFMPSGAVESNFFDTELTDPTTAEFHLALHSHGPLIPEMAADMLSSYRGGCTDESIPPYYPASAASFGMPGPNDCSTTQVAIFMQDQRLAN